MQEIPETGFMRLPQVLSVIPLGKTCWWEGVKSGRFPSRLSSRSDAQPGGPKTFASSSTQLSAQPQAH